MISDDAPAELTALVDELLNSLTSKFSSVSSEIFSKSTFTSLRRSCNYADHAPVDEMSRRLDNLEEHLQGGESKAMP